MDQARVSFGRRIKRLRKQAKLTQEQLAERAGVATSTITRIEQGDRGVSTKTENALAAALGVSFERIRTDERVAASDSSLWPKPARVLAQICYELSDADIDILVRVATRMRAGS
ncbi:MAG TPA: helix-turn-helix transcriptional regulator [Kofleriaceae bacterium]|jgi:transcriptional regulator with XRE-family HTH domain